MGKSDPQVAQLESTVGAVNDFVENQMVVLTLILGIFITELSTLDVAFFEDDETSTKAGSALVLISLGLSFSFLGLACNYFISCILARVTTDEERKKFLDHPRMNQFIKAGHLCFAACCPCLIAAEGVIVCVRYDNHWSSVVVATLLGTAQLLGWVAMWKYGSMVDDTISKNKQYGDLFTIIS